MSISYINSQHFVRLIQQGESGNYLDGNFSFKTLHSGLSLHGGKFVPQQELYCSRLTEPYINFVILLEGGLDFSINRQRYRIDADKGKVVMVAVDSEVLFGRYLHKDETTVKISLKGIEHWLSQSFYRNLLPEVYRKQVRVWPLSEELDRLTDACLKNIASRDLGAVLQQEADALQLLAGLWQDFRIHYPVEHAGRMATPLATDFMRQLAGAFDGGAHQVAELAAAMHISERTLQRRLRNTLGLTASEWLRHKHMQYALYALTATSDSLGEIAFRCGYRHTSSFIQAFKQYYDCTPTEFRQRAI